MTPSPSATQTATPTPTPTGTPTHLAATVTITLPTMSRNQQGSVTAYLMEVLVFDALARNVAWGALGATATRPNVIDLYATDPLNPLGPLSTGALGFTGSTTLTLATPSVISSIVLVSPRVLNCSINYYCCGTQTGIDCGAELQGATVTAAAAGGTVLGTATISGNPATVTTVTFAGSPAAAPYLPASALAPGNAANLTRYIVLTGASAGATLAFRELLAFTADGYNAALGKNATSSGAAAPFSASDGVDGVYDYDDGSLTSGNAFVSAAGARRGGRSILAAPLTSARSSSSTAGRRRRRSRARR